MDPMFISAFVSSIQHVFSTMMQLPVTIGEPTIKQSPSTTYDVSGIIGMSGDVTGNIVLSFPKSTAQRIVQLLTGNEVPVESPDFADAIGELTNMISGNAKGHFQGKKRVSISCPSVIIGPSHIVARPKDVPCVAIPCMTDCGEVVMEIAVQERPAMAAQAA